MAMEQKKILIADDNQNIRDALTYLLEDEGYQLLLARDGAETLQKVREQVKNTYIIMLTAKGQVAEQERGKEVGADEYIVKPFSPMEILAKVKHILQN
jgi:DNA-binding response OmpR family regulator